MLSAPCCDIMSGVGLWAVVKREVREMLRNRLYCSVVFVLPLVMLLFFTIMFYGGAIDNLPVALVDRDKTPMSQELVVMIEATPGIDIAHETQSIDEAERLMLEDKASAIIYIDKGFERKIYEGVPTEVECYVSGVNLSASGVVERDLQTVVETFSSGVALSKLSSLGVEYEAAMANVMPINLHTNIVGNPYLNYGYYLAPIFMVMGLVIFIVVSATYAVGRELRYGTAKEWLGVAGDSSLSAVAGKLLPLTTIFTLYTQLIYSILFMVMGMDCAGSYIMLSLGGALLVIAYQSIALFIVIVTSNLRLALSLGGGYAVMAFTFSGITFPVMAMYGVAQLLSKAFPLTYFSDVFISQAVVGAPEFYDIIDLGAILLFMLPLMIVWRRFGRVVREDQYWGKE